MTADQPLSRRRLQFKIRRALWLVRQALSYDIASGLKRPRFQFSLRTMFVVVTVVALLCPLGVWLVHQWQARTPWLLALVSIGLPVVAIAGLSLVICKTTSSIISDRERMAKIEHDIDPDSSPPHDPTPPSAIQP
jgi:hypothetical protein